MEFAILGPVRVVGPDGAIELKAPKQRALLTMLLVSHRAEAVPSDRLIDVLWGDDPPATAAKALQVHISQLRRALGPENPIVTLPSGYAVRLQPGQLDLERFETLVERAGNEGPEQAADLLSEALALFRGEPFADAPLFGRGAAEADRIAGARLAAIEQRIDLDLDLGRHAAAVAELEPLVAEHPYRERLHAQLMLALYRSGRQADALEAYRRARRNLVEDLGLDPGRDLQRLEAAILAQDPALSLDGGSAAPAAPIPVVARPAHDQLPVPATRLLGREEDVTTGTTLLSDPHVRLLTLTGPGGIGKSRLALEIGRRLAADFEHGARFVSLAALDDPARVRAEIAQALDTTDGEGLVTLLAGSALLLVIDNFEQLLDAAPELSHLLAASPRTKFIVTSRAALRITGEHELAVPPLAAAPSAALFLRRARALDARLELGAGDQERIEQICSRLDGLPLAIELAAARMKVLTPAAILTRLASRLDLLSAGPRDAPLRQQTLRAAIDWSYDLLDPTAQSLFARLGVFVGSFTLEAAEAVCGLDALDGIAALVEQSLVTRRGSRFAMLELVREYALDRLGNAGELDDVRRRHARAYAEMVKGGEHGIESAEIGAWLDRLDADRENVRAAIAFAVADGDAATALALCADVWRYWERRGNLQEARELLASALALEGGPGVLRVRALNGAGALAGEQGDFAAAKPLFEASLALATELGEHYRAARSGGNLGSLALYELDYDEAIGRYEESTAYMRAIDDARGLSLMTQNLGIAYAGNGQHARAVELLHESVALARRAGDPAHLGSALRTLGRLLLADGGDPEPALVLLHEALVLSYELMERPGITESLETLAAVAGREGDPRTGALLIGAAGALAELAGAMRQPDEEAWVLETVTALREAMGEDAFAAAATEGGQLELADAVDRALAMCVSAR